MSLADLQKVPIPYIMEIWHRGGIVRSVSLPRGPSSMQYSRAGGTVLSHTLGKTPIREETEHREWKIKLSGRSGTARRPGYNEKGEVRSLTGLEAVDEFGWFLDTVQNYTVKKSAHYLYNPDKYRKGLRTTALVFRAINEKVHLFVKVDSWSWDRDVQNSRMGAVWSLSLTGWAYAAAPVPTSIFGGLAKLTELAAAFIRIGTDQAAKVENVLTNTRGDLEGLRAPARELSALLSSYTRSAQQTNAIASPLTFASDVFVLADQAQAIIYELGSGIVTGDGLRGLDEIRTGALELIGMAGGGPSNIASARIKSGFPLGNGSKYNIPSLVWTPTIVVLPNDTLQSIALRAYGDAALWVQIAIHNGWQDSLHDANGKPLAPGDELLLPGTPSADGALTPDLYGTDLYVDADGNLELTDDGDVRTVRGVANLTQALTRRLTTRLGDVATAQGYGLVVAPGDLMSLETAGYLASHSREQLLADPRVGEVLSLAVVELGDTLDLDAAIAVVGDTVPLNIVAPLAV